MGVPSGLFSGRRAKLRLAFHFMFDFESMPYGLSAPSKVLEIWAGEFDCMVEREESGVFTLTMHPQVIGRGHRMVLLERFIQHAAQRAARFARMGDMAQELSAPELPTTV